MGSLARSSPGLRPNARPVLFLCKLCAFACLRHLPLRLAAVVLVEIPVAPHRELPDPLRDLSIEQARELVDIQTDSP